MHREREDFAAADVKTFGVVVIDASGAASSSNAETRSSDVVHEGPYEGAISSPLDIPGIVVLASGVFIVPAEISGLSKRSQNSSSLITFSVLAWAESSATLGDASKNISLSAFLNSGEASGNTSSNSFSHASAAAAAPAVAIF